jgi:hypothetical protein
MEQTATCSSNAYALRIEGRKWLDDITIEQAWAVLKAAYQQLQHEEELLFIMLLPSGEMSARCLPRSMFDICLDSPARLAEALLTNAAPEHECRSTVPQVAASSGDPEFMDAAAQNF